MDNELADADDATAIQKKVAGDCGIGEEFSQLNKAVVENKKSKETLEKSMLKVLELLAGISQLLSKAEESSECVPSNAERRVFAAAVKHTLSLIVDSSAATDELSHPQDNIAKAELLSGFPIPAPLTPPWDLNNWRHNDWLPLHWCAVLQDPEVTNEDVCSILSSNENTGIDGKYGHRHSPEARVVRKNNGTHATTLSHTLFNT